MAQQEIEVKLELDGDESASQRLCEQLEKRYGPGRALALTSTYFDTADLALREAAMSLRIREVDGRRVQTIKSRASRKGGMFSRTEWEREVAGDEPDLAAAEETPLAPLLKHEGVKGALAPAFQSIIERTVWDVIQEGGEVELALDRGVVRADGRSSPVCEVELELKSGDPSDLVSLARSLDAMAPLRLGSRTKADRGYQLLQKTDREAVAAEATSLTADMTAGQGFQAIARECLRHFMQNEPLLIRGRSVEALHQVRVALRRLRSALSLFKMVVADDELEPLKARLRGLGQMLGDARDLDVFLAALNEHGPDDAAAHALAGQLRARREEAYDAAVASMATAEARRLMLDLSVWVEAGPWTTAQDGQARDMPLGKFAAEALNRRTRGVRRAGRHLDRLSPDELHQVRIQSKKLRYAVEFFSALHPEKKAARRRRAFLGALKDLQQSLGELNDIAKSETLALRLADTFSDRRTSPSLRRALIYAVGREAGRRGCGVAASRAESGSAFERFKAAKRFW